MKREFDVIASRVIDALGDDGNPLRKVYVHIGRPWQEPEGEWALPYQIEGVGDGKARCVLGFDAVQALQGVHLVIGSILASSDEGERGRLRWAGEANLGFPVPALRSEPTEAEKSLIFAVGNHHIESSGKPPQIDDSAPNCYHGYFENEFGEQAIFVYDRTCHEGTLYLGDAGWEQPYRVIGGIVPGLQLGEAERAWLTACWKAATGT